MHAIRPSYLTAIRLIAVQYLEKATKCDALHCAIYIPQSSGILSLRYRYSPHRSVLQQPQSKSLRRDSNPTFTPT
jgi:hypothetical protein